MSEPKTSADENQTIIATNLHQRGTFSHNKNTPKRRAIDRPFRRENVTRFHVNHKHEHYKFQEKLDTVPPLADPLSTSTVFPQPCKFIITVLQPLLSNCSFVENKIKDRTIPTPPITDYQTLIHQPTCSYTSTSKQHTQITPPCSRHAKPTHHCREAEPETEGFKGGERGERLGVGVSNQTLSL